MASGRIFAIRRRRRTDALERALEGGPITRLVNNVGMVAPASVGDQTLEEFDKVVALNLRCAMQCTQALLPGMRVAGFGRIVNMASRAALGKELRTAYSATKAGLIGMAKTWALELGEYGITANAVGPGPIRTELFDRANPPGAPRTQAIIGAIPVRRVGEPEDVAHAVSYLLDARSCNAQVRMALTGKTGEVRGSRDFGRILPLVGGEPGNQAESCAQVRMAR